ncbi:MAG: ABC transporter permease, partial [Clostridia bacterium]|nr:ABC transporter permease [Clostridia bacterium]
MDKKKIDFKELLRSNAVTIMFVALCIFCMVFSNTSVSYVLMAMVGRLSRNAFIVLALIIPIVAGMGINFAITIGAMAAQIALLWVVEWQITGLGGFVLAALITVPLAAVFGFLIGKLLNKMKGQEMIGGLILGYFANGLYQLLFLFIFGNLIPLNTPGLVIKGSTGVANTISLQSIKYALDNIWSVDFGTALYVMSGVIVVYMILMAAFKKKKAVSAIIVTIVLGACCAVYAFVPAVAELFSMVTVPMI